MLETLKTLGPRPLKFLTFALGVSWVLSARGAQSVSLAWDSESGVAGYALYYGTASGSHPSRVDAGTNTQATVAGLLEGVTYYFVVTAYDGLGLESDPSGEVSFLAPGIVALSPAGATPAVVQFPVAPSHWYELQATPDLLSWTTVWETAAISNCWVQFTLTNTGAMSQQFYRVILH